MKTKTSREAVEPASAALKDGEGRSAGYRGEPASVAPFGSTEYFFDYLWDEGSFPVQQARDGRVSVLVGAGFDRGSSHGGALTQRGPPLQIPSPFSGFGLMIGGAVFGASSSGLVGTQLLAVISCCLFAVLWRGRPRAYGALLRPGTVPRLALERPG